MFLKFKTFSRYLFLWYDIVYFIFEFLLIIEYIIWLNIGVPNKKYYYYHHYYIIWLIIELLNILFAMNETSHQKNYKDLYTRINGFFF